MQATERKRYRHESNKENRGNANRIADYKQGQEVNSITFSPLRVLGCENSFFGSAVSVAPPSFWVYWSCQTILQSDRAFQTIKLFFPKSLNRIIVNKC